MRIRGTVLCGINNIYTVLASEKTFYCRIKGKILRQSEGFYNPIAAGDIVDIEPDKHTHDQGAIVNLSERTNALKRWNRKRLAVQLIAANIDRLFCMTTPYEPPFRPRFIDRLILSEYSNFETIILMNKSDLEIDEETEERLGDYQRIGYRVIRCSAVSGEGIDEVGEMTEEKKCAFAGQSGVGKSTIINILTGSNLQKTGDISRKYNRGRHTTNYSVMIPFGKGAIIDTPGIRDIFIPKTDPARLADFFPDFSPYRGKCAYSTCSHVREDDCAIKKAVERKLIHHDRYKSYVKLYLEMTEMADEIYGPAYT